MRLSYSSQLDWGSYIISIAKIVSKKVRALICFVKFLSLSMKIFSFFYVAIWFYKYIIQLFMYSVCDV